MLFFFHRFQVQCRPLSISMGNGIRFIKRLISSTRDLSDDDTRIHLIASIDEFIDKRIKLADELIIRNLLGLEPHTTAKIVDGDVVLTHGRSHVVEQAIKYASSINITFRVVVVDSRPRMEGREWASAPSRSSTPTTNTVGGGSGVACRRYILIRPSSKCLATTTMTEFRTRTSGTKIFFHQR